VLACAGLAEKGVKAEVGRHKPKGKTSSCRGDVAMSNDRVMSTRKAAESFLSLLAWRKGVKAEDVGRIIAEALLEALSQSNFPSAKTWLICAGLAERGVKAEDVGRIAAEALLEALAAGGCVDEWLQDQLVVFMALADGRSVHFRLGAITCVGSLNLDDLPFEGHALELE